MLETYLLYEVSKKSGLLLDNGKLFISINSSCKLIHELLQWFAVLERLVVNDVLAKYFTIIHVVPGNIGIEVLNGLLP